MTPSVGKKLSLFTGLLLALATAGVGVVSYLLLEQHLADSFRRDTLDTAALLSSRLRNELRHVAEKGRFLASAALEEFKNPEDQIRYLEENLTLDDQFLAVSLFRRSAASQGKWVPVFRLTRPEGDPAFLEENAFHDLDLKYPLDFQRASAGEVDVAVGKLNDSTPILRMALPIVRKRNGVFTQILTLEIRQERLTAAFAEATAHFSFLLDRNGRVLTQTDPTHFTFGEDLSHLPILIAARATEAPSGNLDYQELPGGILQYGSFQKLGYADLVVVSQASRMHVLLVLRDYARQALLVAAASVFIGMALMLLASWGVVGHRLRRLAQTLARVGDGHLKVSFPFKNSEDEIGGFASVLQESFDQLDSRQHAHGTFAKLKNRRVKARIEEGKVNFNGERTHATIACCRLHGLEKAAAHADPTVLIELLNRFNTAAAQAIESTQGIVDEIRGGTVVAYWGVPVPDKKDADHALTASLAMREAAAALNNELKRNGVPEVSLAIGMHYGPVVAGQIGTADRLEYTALGEAVEIASRIQTFTDQFGTDILVTASVLAHAPRWFKTEKVAAADDSNPELHELVGKARTAGMPQNTDSDEDQGHEGAAADSDSDESEPKAA